VDPDPVESGRLGLDPDSSCNKWPYINFFGVCVCALKPVLRSRSRLFWSEPEPQRDAAPAPTVVFIMVRNLK
jgi:hypothetical protein